MGPAGHTGAQPSDLSSALEEAERFLGSIETSLENGTVDRAILRALDESMRGIAAQVKAVGSTVAEKFFSLTYRRELLNPKLLRATALFSQENGRLQHDDLRFAGQDDGALSAADLSALGTQSAVGLGSTLRFSTRDAATAQSVDAPAQRGSLVMSRLTASVRDKDASAFVPRLPPLFTRVSHLSALPCSAEGAGAQQSPNGGAWTVAAVVHSGHAALAFARPTESQFVLALTQPALPAAALQSVRLVHNNVSAETASQGSLLALCTPTGIAVVAMPRAAQLSSALAESCALPPLHCCITSDGVLGSTGVLDAFWHPLSPRHLLVLCTDAVRVYAVSQGRHLAMSLVDTLAIPSSALVPVTSLDRTGGGTLEAPVAEPVAMRMGAARGWEMLCIYVLCTDGGLRVICPYLPPEAVLPVSHWSDLLSDAQATATMEFSMLQAESEAGAVGPQEAEQARLAAMWLSGCFVDAAGDGQFKRYIGGRGATHPRASVSSSTHAATGASDVLRSHIAAVQIASSVLPHLAPATAGSSACDFAVVPANVSRGNPCVLVLFTDGSIVGLVATHPVRPCFQDRSTVASSGAAAGAYGSTLGMSFVKRAVAAAASSTASSCGSWLVVHASNIEGLGRAMDCARVHVSLGRASYAGGFDGAGVAGSMEDWTAAFRPSSSATNRSTVAMTHSAVSSVSVMGSPSSRIGANTQQPSMRVSSVPRDIVHVPSLTLLPMESTSMVHAASPVNSLHCTAVVHGRHAAYEIGFPWLLHVDDLSRALSGQSASSHEDTVDPVLKAKQALDNSGQAHPFEVFRTASDAEDILGLVVTGSSLLPVLSLWTCAVGSAPRVHALHADSIQGMLSPYGKPGQGEASQVHPEPVPGKFQLRGVYSPVLPLASPLTVLQEAVSVSSASSLLGGKAHTVIEPAAAQLSEDLATFLQMQPLEVPLQEAMAVLTAGLRIFGQRGEADRPQASGAVGAAAAGAPVVGSLTPLEMQSFVSDSRALASYARAIESLQKTVTARRALMSRVGAEVRDQGQHLHESIEAVSAATPVLKLRAERAAAKAGNLQARAQALAFALQLCSPAVTSSEVNAHKDLAASHAQAQGMMTSAEGLRDKLNRVQAALDVSEGKGKPGLHPVEADEILASLEAAARTRAQTRAELHALEIELQRRVAAVHVGASQLAASAVLNA